jgi:membrane-associated phospholipid phosphatase
MKKPWLTLVFSFLLAVCGGLIFLLTTLLVRADKLRSIDFDITVKIQHNVPEKLDHYFLWFGTIAKFQVIVPLTVIVLLLMRRWLIAVSSLALLFFAHLLEIVGKEILFQPPPPFMFYRHPTEFVFPDLHTFDHSSYPSGHSMRIVFAAMTLGLAVWQVKKLPVIMRAGVISLFAGVALMTMFTRVSLGEHWTTDVVGGAGLGILAAGLNWMVMFFSVERSSTKADTIKNYGN